MKLGVIDHDYINEIVDAVNNFNSIKQELEIIASKGQKKQSSQIIAKLAERDIFSTVTITRFNGVESTLPVIWRYSFVLQKLVSVTTDVGTSGSAEGSVNWKNSDSAYSTGTIQDLYKNPEDEETPEVGYAFNLSEINAPEIYETTDRIFGIDVTGESYPEGFEPQGIQTPAIVILKKMTDESGKIWFFFDRRNVHDGTCT